MMELSEWEFFCSTVIATLCMQDFTEAATIVFLFSVADWLESSAAHKVCLCRVSICSKLWF